MLEICERKYFCVEIFAVCFWSTPKKEGSFFLLCALRQDFYSRWTDFILDDDYFYFKAVAFHVVPLKFYPHLTSSFWVISLLILIYFDYAYLHYFVEVSSYFVKILCIYFLFIAYLFEWFHSLLGGVTGPIIIWVPPLTLRDAIELPTVFNNGCTIPEESIRGFFDTHEKYGVVLFWTYIKKPKFRCAGNSNSFIGLAQNFHFHKTFYPLVKF